MICLEDYEFSYDIFLAEQSLFEDIVDLDIKITNENTGIISIEEGIKDTLLKYLTKIKNAVQKVWERFKNALTDAIDGKYLNMIKDRVKNFDPNCEISNFPEIDYNTLNSIKIKDFDYNTMRDHLDSVDHYIDTEYSGTLPKTGDQTIEERLEAKCVKMITIECHNKELLDIYKYVSTDFKDDIKILEGDIKNINDSQQNIVDLANSGIDNVEVNNKPVKTQESAIIEANISHDPSSVQGNPAGSMMKGGSNNANNNTQQQATTTKVGTTNNQNDPDNTNPNYKQLNPAETEEEKQKRDQVLKQVQVYMSASCSLLSAKLKICRNKYKKYMKVLKHFIPMGNAIVNKNKPEQKVTNIDKSKYEIKI